MGVCICGFCDLPFCVCVGFVMYCCVYVWVSVMCCCVCMCGFYNVWFVMFGYVYVLVLYCVCVCMCVFCNVLLCVYVWVL